MGIIVPCASVGFLVFYVLKPTIILTVGTVLFFVLISFCLRWPETGTLVVLFAIYSNISVLAMRSSNAIEASAGSADRNPRILVVLGALSLFLAIPLLYQMLVRKDKLIFDRGFLLMLLYLTAGLASSFFVYDQRTMLSEIGDFLVEGLALYFLLVNVTWDFSVLRRAIWALLLAGSLMAGVTVYQKVTHTEKSNYGGFAQVDSGPKVRPEEQERQDRLRAAGKTDSGGETVGNTRAAGPIGGANEYGQILLILLPLAILQFRTESTRALRVLSAVAACILLGGLLLTYSRACMLGGVAVFGMMIWMGLLKPRHALVTVLGGGLLIAFLAPTAVTRMESLSRLKGLFSRTVTAGQEPDSSAMNRYVLDLALWHVFLDHPILGVGPGQFAKHYSIDYVNRVGTIELTRTYQPHNLYLEMLAEGGLIGTVCFFSILATIMYGLWKTYIRFKQSRPELGFAATAFFLSLSGYAITSVFAHLAYQRYLWLLLALSSAAIRIIDCSSTQETMDELPLRQTVVPKNRMFRLEADDAYSE